MYVSRSKRTLLGRNPGFSLRHVITHAPCIGLARAATTTSVARPLADRRSWSTPPHGLRPLPRAHSRTMAFPLLPTARIARIADLSGTFFFALEGGLTGLAVGLDPIGVLVLAFLTGLGGGLVRDVLIGALPPAAIADWHYSVIILAATAAVLALHTVLFHMPPGVVVAFDAAGLAMATIAGTEKSLDRGIHPMVAIFLGTVGGVGGGTIRDVVINQVPRILHTDIYATAAIMTAAIVVLGRRARLPARGTAITAAIACFTVRMLAHTYQWHLPTWQ